MKVLRIKDWKRHEHADAKKGTRMPWVKTPTAHDGLGFLTLMDHQDGMAHFGAWNLIMQVAANCPTRGLLITDAGRPIGAKELFLKTRGSIKIFTAAIPRLIDIGWLEWVDISGEHAGSDQQQSLPERSGSTGSDTDRSGATVSGECQEHVLSVSGMSPDIQSTSGVTQEGVKSRGEREQERERKRERGRSRATPSPGGADLFDGGPPVEPTSEHHDRAALAEIRRHAGDDAPWNRPSWIKLLRTYPLPAILAALDGTNDVKLGPDRVAKILAKNAQEAAKDELTPEQLELARALESRIQEEPNAG